VVKEIRNILEKYADAERPPHFLFIGPVGTGKTSTARCLVKECFTRYSGEAWKKVFHTFNGREIGVKDARDYFRRVSLLKGKRFVFIDEADGMSTEAQEEFRTILENTTTTTFIFSCNEADKITKAIKSRCVVFKFKKLKDEDVLNKLLEICKVEGCLDTENPIGREAFKKLITYANGDLRKALDTLERFITENGLDYGGMREL